MDRSAFGVHNNAIATIRRRLSVNNLSKIYLDRQTGEGGVAISED
jgi:hypothetical protein